MKQCPHCKSEILDDSLYCDRCGQHLMICADCGTFARGKFCPNCGGKQIIDPLDYEAKHGRAQVSLSEPESHQSEAQPQQPPVQQPKPETPQPHKIEQKGGGPMICATLCSVNGVDKKLTLSLNQSQQYVIGRKSPQFASELAICSKMSRNHAKLFYDAKDKEWFVEDLNSSHGTRINGQRISTDKIWPLKDGDTIAFASYEFKFSTGTPNPDKDEGKLAFDRGYEYENNKEYEEAMTWYQKAAKLGSPSGMSSIGYLYEYGLGVDTDPKEAMRWYLQAAEKGSNFAMWRIGSLYDCGDGVEQDYKEAMQWYRKAADNGHSDAMLAIGDLYYLGNGVPESNNKARTWWLKAVDTDNNTDAMIRLGDYYKDEQNLVETMNWYLRASDSGDSEGSKKLGEIFHYGYGELEKDLEKAAEMYQLAIDQGDEEAEISLEIVQAEMQNDGNDNGEETDNGSSYDVFLESAGAEDLQVIKVIKEQKGCSVSEAFRLVKSEPVTIMQGISWNEAQKIKETLESFDADVTINKSK